MIVIEMNHHFYPSVGVHLLYDRCMFVERLLWGVSRSRRSYIIICRWFACVFYGGKAFCALR